MSHVLNIVDIAKVTLNLHFLSGKVCERRKPKRIMSKREILSTYPSRKNIWEYLYENNNENFNYSEIKVKVTEMKKNKTRKIIIILLILFLISAGVVTLLMSNEISRADLITKVISRGKFMTLLGSNEWSGKECYQRIVYLTSKLSKIENALRYKIPQPKPMTSSTNTFSEINSSNIKHRYIKGAIAVKGIDTKEWGGRVALWGIVPLWRAAPPLNTIFALRRTTPSDCWSFSGSRGEIIIHLPHIQSIFYVSIEHIRPDTTKSAPKNFEMYGILINDTWIKLIQNQYKTQGPAKQFYPIKIKNVLKSIVLRFLTNQGNREYTCIYRFHMYGNVAVNTVETTRFESITV